MFIRKSLQIDSENYYIPFLDLMSGIVFILMIILSITIINIRYNDVQNKETAPVTKTIEPIELLKKEIVNSISNYLKKNNISNKISEDYDHIIIYNSYIFDNATLLLNKKGKNIINT